MPNTTHYCGVRQGTRVLVGSQASLVYLHVLMFVVVSLYPFALAPRQADPRVVPRLAMPPFQQYSPEVLLYLFAT